MRIHLLSDGDVGDNSDGEKSNNVGDKHDGEKRK